MLAHSSPGWPCVHTGRPPPQKYNGAGHKHLQQQRFIAAVQRKPHRKMTNVYLECLQTAASPAPLDCWGKGALPCPARPSLPDSWSSIWIQLSWTLSQKFGRSCIFLPLHFFPGKCFYLLCWSLRQTTFDCVVVVVMPSSLLPLVQPGRTEMQLHSLSPKDYLESVVMAEKERGSSYANYCPMNTP